MTGVPSNEGGMLEGGLLVGGVTGERVLMRSKPAAQMLGAAGV